MKGAGKHITTYNLARMKKSWQNTVERLAAAFNERL
jgi:hypothetical protein